MPAATHVRAFRIDHDTSAFAALAGLGPDDRIDTSDPDMRRRIDAALQFTRAQAMPLCMHLTDAVATARVTLEPALRFCGLMLSHAPRSGVQIEDQGLKDQGGYYVDVPQDPTTLVDLPDDNDTVGALMHQMVSDAIPTFGEVPNFPTDALAHGLSAFRDRNYAALFSRKSQPIEGTQLRAQVDLYLNTVATVRVITLIHRGRHLATVEVARDRPGMTHVPKKCASIHFDGDALHIAQMGGEEHEWWKSVTKRRNGIGPLAAPVTVDLAEHPDVVATMREKV